MNSLVSAVLCACFVGVLSSNWHYGDESHWPDKCRTGESQSPINLDEQTSTKTTFVKFHFHNYDVKLPAAIKNNGHSVQLNLNVGTPIPKMTGGGLSREYTLDHLHFHWQSEHTINNHRFPLEVHLVHYATDYGNLNNGLKHPDGVAVLGVFYDYSPDDDDEFQPIIEIMEDVENQLNIIKPANKTKIDGFLPRDTAGFYRYNGSLTTPNCTESVIWTVFSNTIPISKTQIKHFESVHSEEGGLLKANYRSLQDIKGRTIYQKVSPIPHSGANLYFEDSALLSLMVLIIPGIL